MKYVINGLLLSILCIQPIYYNTTYIKKEIIIKQKYIRNSHKNDYVYMFSDINNNIYSTNNEWWKLNFNRAENWNKLESNQKYIIYGYGIRFKYLDIYPCIININKLNN